MDWSAILDRVLGEDRIVPKGYRAVGPRMNEMQDAPNEMQYVHDNIAINPELRPDIDGAIMQYRRDGLMEYLASRAVKG